MRRVYFVSAFTFVLLLLTGCVKARIAIDVEPDGSGTVAASYGATPQAMALAGSDGSSAMQILSESMSDTEGAEDVTVRRWYEGDYEWVEVSMPFETLDDLNTRINSTEIFSSFSVVQRKGLLHDRFILLSTVDPLLDSDYQEEVEDLIIDPSGLFEFHIAINLPGEVVETNGIFEGESNTILWSVDSQEQISINAISETLKQGSVIAIVLMGFITGSIAFGLLVFFDRRRMKHTNSQDGVSGESTEQERKVETGTSARQPDQLYDISADVAHDQTARYGEVPMIFPETLRRKVRIRLEQVNQHLLKGQGIIKETPVESRLVWLDSDSDTAISEIIVQVVDHQSLLMNGRKYPTTDSGIQEGILSSLKNLSRI